MSPTLASFVGAGVGLAFGVADYSVLGVSRNAARRDGPRRLPGILQVVRVLQLVFFPVAGWFAGPFVASNLAG